MEVLKPRVNNVKVSFRLDVSEHVPLLKKLAYKITKSYVILRRVYTFSIFKKANIVNITGIPSFEEVPAAVERFATIISLPSAAFRVVVDSSTASGQFPQKLQFHLLSEVSDCAIRYNPSRFPGACLTLPNNKKVNLFKSGKYSILGCKSPEEIDETFRFLEAAIVKSHNGELYSPGGTMY